MTTLLIILFIAIIWLIMWHYTFVFINRFVKDRETSMYLGLLWPISIAAMIIIIIMKKLKIKP